MQAANPLDDGVFAMRRSHVFVISALLAALGALLALQCMSWVFALGAAFVFLLTAPALGSSSRGAAVLALSFLLGFFIAQNRLEQLFPPDQDLSQLRANFVSFSGRVLTVKTKDTDQGRVAVLEVSPVRLLLPWSKKLAGKVLVHTGPYTEKSQPIPAWGAQYVFTGRLIKTRAQVFSFEFDERRWLALKQIYCQVSCNAADIQTCRSESAQGACAAPLAAVAEDWLGQIVQASLLLRQGIVADHCRVLGEERGKLLTSMVLGDRAVSLSDQLKAAFARVGLSHLLAASGLNLTIIVGAVMFFFGLAGRGRRQAAGLVQTLGALVCVLFFVSLAGASPSVTRATIMCLLLLWSSLVFRKLAAGAALAVALWIALLIDPLSILDVGLELSYGATFGIIYFYPVFTAALPQWLAKKPWHWLCAVCAVVVSAQLAVLPVQIYYFQKISTLVLPANMLAEPLVAPITILGFLSSLISSLAMIDAWLAVKDCAYFCHLHMVVLGLAQALQQISGAIDFCSGYLIDLLLLLTRYLGALPLSYLYLARPNAAACVFYYLGLAVAFILALSNPRRGALVALTLGLILTVQSFLSASCLEILVAKDRVVVSSLSSPPLLLVLPPVANQGADSRRSGCTKGYLPAFHRDFVQAYLRSLSGRGDSRTITMEPGGQVVSLPPAQLRPLNPGGGATGEDSGCFLWRHSQSAAALYLTASGPQLFSTLPAAAVECEEAQGVRLYKFKNWGLGYLWLAKMWQAFAFARQTFL